MKETKGNLWDYPAQARVITTNGTVKNDLYAVMGRGCAREACIKYPGMAKTLGKQLAKFGNHSYAFIFSGQLIISYPVKHNWWEFADFPLIERSANELVENVNRLKIETVVMPRPGCGNGKRLWTDVKPIIEPLLDDRFTVITYA